MPAAFAQDAGSGTNPQPSDTKDDAAGPAAPRTPGGANPPPAEIPVSPSPRDEPAASDAAPQPQANAPASPQVGEGAPPAAGEAGASGRG